MKIGELIKELQKLNPDKDIAITNMSDHFYELNFCVRSEHEDEEVEEIIMDNYYEKEVK